MVFNTSIKGKVLDKKITKKGKTMLKIYDGNTLVNVFENEYYKFDDVEVDDNVDINVNVIADNCFIRVGE